MNLGELEKKLGVKFKDPDILIRALTHRSFLNEARRPKPESNERLEFLGDAILSFVISKLLYQQFPHHQEGNLTNIRSNLVKASSLAKIGEELTIGDYLLLSRGEEDSGGRRNLTLIANAVEALIGAIFLDQGAETVEDFIRRFFSGTLESIIRLRNFKDSKNILQEKIQSGKIKPPVYKILNQRGPDHNKIFTVGVFVKNKLLAKGVGKNKLEAEKEAARTVLKTLLK